jgi:beta-lactamase regulating signal transducer with metallopeptidase domain
MTPVTAIQASTGLLAHLADSAVRTVLLCGVAGFGIFVLRVKTASARLFTWTAVLYAALAMPLLKWMLPPLPIATPAFLQSASVSPVDVHSQTSQSTQRSLAPNGGTGDRTAAEKESSSKIARQAPTRPSQPIGETRSIMAPPSHSAARWSLIPWSGVAVGIYLAVALLLFARLLVGLIFARRLVRAAQSLHELRITQALVTCAQACGLGCIPFAAESAFVSVPVTVGILRSTILLPGGWREWEDAKLNAVIAHEVSHVARRDALTQCVSLLHRAIFWFSPLAWWLDRHLADLAEHASDEAALSCGADRTDYARTLLGFFGALQAAPGRVWWQGVAMAKSGQAEQRLEKILEWKQAGGTIAMGLKKSVLVMIIALAIPAVYVAASARPVKYNQISPAQRAQDAPQPAPAAAQPSVPVLAPVAPSISHGPSGGIYLENSSEPVAPTTSAAQVAPIGPISAWAGQAGASTLRGYSHSYGYDDDSRFVIVTGNSDSITMSGSTEDAHHAEKLRKQIPGDFIWFERDEQSYIIRDQATIARARQFWQPEEALGAKQAALGKQQEALGKQQEALGDKQRQVQVKVPDMTAQLDKLKAELKQLSSGATQDQLGKIQSEMGELQSRLSETQSEAGEQQSALGEQQSALGAQQSKLGEQQSELGRQQSELSREAARKMKGLLDEAIKNGTAKPETEGGKATL